MPTGSAGVPVLIYDGDCGLCQRAVALVRRRMVPGALETLPCQAPERAARFPHVSEEACLSAMQLAFPDGHVYAGAEALPPLLRRLRGYRWLARVLELPDIRAVSPPVYAWIARHRQFLSHVAGAKPPDSCPIDPDRRG